MKITVITLFPKMVSTFFEESIIKRAQNAGVVEINVVDLRSFGKGEYRQVDDRPYGGGAGMVMRADVLHEAQKSVISDPLSDKTKTILTSAKGKIFNQLKAQEYSKLDHLVIIAGHYEGVDDRSLKFIDEEVSMGDFVMTGGEIAASAIADAVVRLIPGALKKEDATQEESFFIASVEYLTEAVGDHPILEKLTQKGLKEVTLLEYPHFTRPEEYEGQKVPEVLLGGNHAEIKKWRLKKAFEETLKRRPDLLED